MCLSPSRVAKVNIQIQYHNKRPSPYNRTFYDRMAYCLYLSSNTSGSFPILESSYIAVEYPLLIIPSAERLQILRPFNRRFNAPVNIPLQHVLRPGFSEFHDYCQAHQYSHVVDDSRRSHHRFAPWRTPPSLHEQFDNQQLSPSTLL